MFETLWIDTPEADAMLKVLAAEPATAELAQLFKHFREFGYCIIPGAVSHDVIDRYTVEYRALVEADKLQISRGLEVMPAKGADLLIPLTKLLDTNFCSTAAQRISFAPRIKAFLEYLFKEPALAFQGLHFETGSTQAVHNDTAYVVLDEPKSLAASWVALEDIQEGSGELVYYPGGHKFGEFLYQNKRKNWSLPDDGHDIHNHHLHWLNERAKELGIELQTFHPKKGDALIWHADLPHGGGPITKPNMTRRSMVTHYCPVHCIPHYFQFLPEERQVKRRVEAGGYVSSYYYT
jgi:ectoine hydroxylase-related dioxygenase (phytanoyl-CoA dioxygenase family)